MHGGAGYGLPELYRDLSQHQQAIQQLQAGQNGIAAQLRQVSTLSEQAQQQIIALRQQLQSGLGQDSSQVQAQVQRVQDVVSELQQKINFDASSLSRPRTIDDIPGIRTPRWYTVEIAVAELSTARANNTINIDPAGPFIVEQIQAMWQYTDTDIVPAGLLGRVLPISAYGMLIANGGQTAIATIITNLVSFVPEISLEIEVSGSGRFWTNQKLYGPSLYCAPNNPLYLGTQGWVDTTDAIRTWITPEVAMTFAGKVIVTYHGFQILTSLRISQLLGFAE